MPESLKKQTNYRQALARGFELLRGRDAESTKKLGAALAGSGRLELPVLEGAFLVDAEAGICQTTGGEELRIEWQILAVHYLGAEIPGRELSRWVSFPELAAEARAYESAYRGRVLGRLTATAGRDRETFTKACRRLGGEPVDGPGDEGFEFRVFPNVPVRLAWYAGDDELPPGAAMVYGDNVTDFLPVEDVIVLSERLVARLARPGW